jgi:hypothetical protein
MKHMNYRRLITVAAIPALGLSLLTVGCDRTVSKTEDTHVSSDGTVKTKDKTVTEHPDGTVTKTETKQTTAPEKP